MLFQIFQNHRQKRMSIVLWNYSKTLPKGGAYKIEKPTIYDIANKANVSKSTVSQSIK